MDEMTEDDLAYEEWVEFMEKKNACEDVRGRCPYCNHGCEDCV